MEHMEASGVTAKQALQVYLETETIARLEALAKQQDRSKGYFVRQAVELYLCELEALQSGASEALECRR
jgi:predicted DNA-binding protein